MERFYERYWSDRPDGRLGDFERKWPVLAPLIPRDAAVTILDYGCGKGDIIGEMRRLNPGARYFGVDVSETALGIARERLPGVVLHRVEDGAPVPVETGTVDFIFSSEVIEHVYDTEATFREFSRLLRSGGHVLLTTPYHGFVKNVLLVALAFDRHFNPTGPHIRFFSKRSLFKCLRDVGIEPKRHGYIGRFLPIPMSIYVLARKGS